MSVEESTASEHEHVNREEQRPRTKIIGLEVPIFFGVVAIVLIGVYMEILPDNLTSGLIVAMVLGGALKWVGDRIPVFNTFGGGPILCILIPALFLYWGIFPESLATLTDDFYTTFGFADLAVTGIIVGSILSMDRNLLMKIGIRFFVPLLGAVLCGLLAGGLAGQLIGFGFTEAMFFVVGPIMGGGMAAGAVPMSEIYAASQGGDPGEVLARLAPAVMVGNMICILVAGALNGLGKRKNKMKNFSGDGAMLRTKEKEQTFEEDNNKDSAFPFSINNLIIGIVISLTLYILGNALGSLIPALHPYVWIILGAALLKIINILPMEIEKAAGDWYEFITKAWVPAVLVAISAGMIDFASVLEIVTNPSYISLTILTVIMAALAAGFIGLMVGFYFVESAIGAGLGMADMGGSGDVAVLSAGDRMGLMPFLQISSRLGGAMMLVLLSLLSSILM
ncbi:2-hydroxycarboxylate transporter family protein [Salibacterium aidingense]|uniref:2-hydroxycarboxylate transporter family protein n=1 Tax=Salibacterium aidingense TaxID=384933 RepID=UPI003BC7D962